MNLQIEHNESQGDVPRTAVILLVEDERDYAALIRDTIRDPALPHILNVVETGEKAISYLAGEGKYANRAAYPLPFLMLLDLKMPGTSGFGVLRWLFAHRELKDQMKIAILSSAQSSREIDVAYELGAQFFWPKSDGPSLQDRVRRLKEAWLKSN